MKKSISYQIAGFREEGFSINNINCIMESSNKNSWKTKSSYATLEIFFQPVGDFEVHLGKK
jgi:hypothetical protein